MSQMRDIDSQGDSRGGASDATGRGPVSLSWLVLEAYALGELDDEQAARVEARLATDDESRQCVDLIRAQRGRVLPPLPDVKVSGDAGASASPASPASPGSLVLAWLKTWLGGRNLGWGVAAAGAAVAVLVFVLLGRGGLDDPEGAGWPGPRAQIKGGDVMVLGMVRERRGAISHEPATFAPGDRFKLVVTCAPGRSVRARVVVYQDGEASFPLDPVSDLACGNRVAIRGAFRITGEGPATVCLVHDPDSLPSRRALRGGLGDHRALCVSLSSGP